MNSQSEQEENIIMIPQENEEYEYTLTEEQWKYINRGYWEYEPEELQVKK